MGKTYEALKKNEAHRNGRQDAEPADARSLALRERSPVDDLLDPTMATNVGYQKLRVWLGNRLPDGRLLRTAMIVSCRSNTGTTTTSAFMAATLAQGTRSRVLLIDGNFRTPSLNMVFQVKNNGGFTEVIREGRPIEAQIQPTTRDNLFVLTSGKVNDSAFTIYEEETFTELVEHLKQKFDYILFDAAPVMEFPDAFALASKVDVVILVVEADGTPIHEAKRAKLELERAGARMLGVVLNRQKDYTPKMFSRFFGSLA